MDDDPDTVVRVQARDRLTSSELLSRINTGFKSELTMSECMLEDPKALMSLTRLRAGLDNLIHNSKRVSIRYSEGDYTILTQ